MVCSCYLVLFEWKAQFSFRLKKPGPFSDLLFSSSHPLKVSGGCHSLILLLLFFACLLGYLFPLNAAQQYPPKFLDLDTESKSLNICT